MSMSGSSGSGVNSIDYAKKLVNDYHHQSEKKGG